MIRLAVFSALLCTALATPMTAVKEEYRTAFLGEDFHIILPSVETSEVLFKPSRAPVGSEQVLMREGQLLSPRVDLQHRNQLQVLQVGQGDGGTYIVKYSDDPEDVKHIILTVRDCYIDANVKYGETFTIFLKNISGPISLEFRPSPEGNATAAPMVLILDRSWTPVGEYAARLSAQEQKITLHTVTASDEGSYAVLDSERSVKQKVCLNVKEHLDFVKLPHSGTLKINLILNSTKVRVLHTLDKDPKSTVILDQGELADPLDPALEGRLSLEGSTLILERVQASDVGTFSVIDLQGFMVSKVYLQEVEGSKLPPLIVAVISLLSLLVFLLFVCLVSCLVKVRRRAMKAKAIEKIAQNAGKDEGDAFRQVVQDACIRLNEDSATPSQCDTSTTKTEVEIKGLEVSKNLLEMSDSGVEFNAPGLPLDSDTDGPPTYTSPKSQLDSEQLNSTAVTETKPSINQTPDPKASTDKTPDSKPSTDKTPDPKPSTDKSPDPKPSSDKTPDPKPSTDKTPDPKPTTEKAPDPKPSTDKTHDPKPTADKTSEKSTIDKTPDPTPSTDKTPDPKPTADKTPDPKPTADKTPDPKPTADKTPDPKPTADKTPDPKPTADKPADPKPSTDKPADSKLTTDKTPEPKPTTYATPDSKPNTEKTPDPGLTNEKSTVPKPSTDKTPEPKPSSDKTLDNLGVNGITAADSKPGDSHAPEPVAKSTPEADPAGAAADAVAKSSKPGASDTPTNEADTGTSLARDAASGGPPSEAVIDGSPVQDTSKEKAAT